MKKINIINTIVDGYPFKVNYLNVIEVNYLGEKL